MSRTKGSKNKKSLSISTQESVPTATIAVIKKRGRPKKNSSAVSSPLNETAADNSAVIGEKLMYIGNSGILYRRSIWKNVPSDLVVNENTPIGSRLVYAGELETKFFLKNYIPAGSHDPSTKLFCASDAVSVMSRSSDYIHVVALDTVMIHSSKQVREELPKEAQYYTGGHRDGTAAAEKAAKRELKRKERQQKRDEKQAKKQAKIDAKNAKLEEKRLKKQARLDKKAAKELKRQQRLIKQDAKKKKKLKQAKISGSFFVQEKQK